MAAGRGASRGGHRRRRNPMASLRGPDGLDGSPPLGGRRRRRAPYVYRDADGKLVGFEVDLANEFAGRLDLRSEFVQKSWENLPEGTSGGATSISSSTVTSGRRPASGGSISTVPSTTRHRQADGAPGGSQGEGLHRVLGRPAEAQQERRPQARRRPARVADRGLHAEGVFSLRRCPGLQGRDDRRDGPGTQRATRRHGAGRPDGGLLFGARLPGPANRGRAARGEGPRLLRHLPAPAGPRPARPAQRGAAGDDRRRHPPQDLRGAPHRLEQATGWPGRSGQGLAPRRY